MFHSTLFKLGFTCKYKHFMRLYNEAKKAQYMPYDVLKQNQEKKLRKLILFAYHNVPYYHKLFKKLNLKPGDIRTIEDLQKLPILTKEIIKKNQKDFIPNNLSKQKYINASTGGSTGQPLQYRISIEDALLDVVLFYVNCEQAGYRLGDKMAVFAGSQLVPSTKSSLVKKIKGWIINTKYFSSFDMSDRYLDKVVEDLNRFKPRFLRGYASSVFLLAKHIADKNLELKFEVKGVFTSSEVLFDYQRALIEEVFNCKVFDQYSQNDGGASMFECEKHNGLHIDMFRSIVEVVDEEGKQLDRGTGHILATSLHNYAMPFIRYDTGDMGILSDKKCDCGREMPLMEKIIGRVSDFIYAPNGNRIHGEFFSHIFRSLDGGYMRFSWVKEFQVVQRKINELTIKIVPDDARNINDSDLNKLKEIILNRTGEMDITIEIVDEIERTKAGKWKFIINEVKS